MKSIHVAIYPLDAEEGNGFDIFVAGRQNGDSGR
jgi:hypothetical protein